MTYTFGIWSGDADECTTEEVQFTNDTAVHLLVLLDLSTEPDGEVDPRALLRRCHVALRTLKPAHDEPRPWSTHAGKPNFHRGSRHAGATTERLTELKALAEKAIMQRAPFVAWN